MDIEPCIWTLEDNDESYWSASCGQDFYISEGKPSENGMIYCPFCGKPLQEQIVEE